MTILDRHVLGSWLKAFGLIMTALLGLLILVDMQNNLGNFTGSGAGLLEVLYYYLVLIPGNVPLVLQVSVLLSLLYALGQMHRSNEFTAMRAAGLGLLRITRSIWLFGLLLAVGVWYLNDSLIPWSVEQARTSREQMRRSAGVQNKGEGAGGVVAAVGFANPAAGRLWFLNAYDQTSRRGRGVTLGLFDAAKHEVRRIEAKEAYFDRWRKTWVFLDGRELRFDALTGEQLPPVRFVDRIDPEIDDDPELMLLLLKDAADLSLFELERVLAHLNGDGTPRQRRYAVEHERKRSSPIGVLIVVALAVPFAIAGVRVNPAVNMTKSIGLFFVYFLLAKLATMMGTFGILSPVAAAWLPDATMAAVALWVFARLR
jgi:lipopolysaccharide export system permease protein